MIRLSIRQNFWRKRNGFFSQSVVNNMKLFVFVLLFVVMAKSVIKFVFNVLDRGKHCNMGISVFEMGCIHCGDRFSRFVSVSRVKAGCILGKPSRCPLKRKIHIGRVPV